MSEKEVDQLLVERVQQGDSTAFDLLVIKYQSKVKALVARLLMNSGAIQDVDDVAQEAFIKAYRALPKFRGDSAFYTWLYRIAINTAKNHLLSRSRQPRGVDADIDEAEQFDSAVGLKDIETPESSALTEEIKATIHAAISTLSNDLKAAITLREFDGLSYEEIADILDCPVGTVRSRIFRARDAIDLQLRPLLER